MRTTARLTLLAVFAALLSGCANGASAPEASPAGFDVDGFRASFDIEEFRANQLAEYAAALQLNDPPVVAIVRTVTPEEQAAVYQQCMSEAGFPANNEGLFSVPDDQGDALNLALYTCAAQYPLEEKYVTPLSVDQLTIVHSYYRDSLVPCLAEHGYAVAEPPTIETFLANVGTSREYSPYALVPTGLSPEEEVALQQACPGLPPAEDLYAD